jgi:two-component system sensor histidine kinase KdpD
MQGDARETGRPDPDALLREVEKAESPQGKLKVFLGYSPGVGKTYSMLMEARIRRRRGDDVVVGVVETHGRSETALLLEGLEVIPRLTGDYKGIPLDEMDLDAVLARRPEVVLVDELAHSNAPWCRHPKRFQDVVELLRAGIDVCTTLNVQHLESQNDVITRITGVRMKETLPDWIIDEAEEIQIIDVPLETLFDRLREGKVYVPEEARRAVEAFFQRGHLVALREIALNIVARKMDTELLNYRRARAVSVPWPASEKLMVCLGATTSAPELVRKAYRMAKDRNAEWYAVHVAVPVVGPQAASRQAYLAEALNLAERFGAQTITLSGPDVVPTLLQFARENNVSQIVVGRPRQTTFLGTLRGYPVYWLLRKQNEFDLVLIAPTVPKQRTGQPTPRRRMNRGYITALFILAAASGANLLIEPYANPTSLYAIYLLSTLVIALSFGLGPSVWTAILSFLAFDFLFIAPKYTLAIKHATDLVGALVFLVTSIAVGQLIQVSRRQSIALRARLNRSSLLEDLARDLLEATTTAGREKQRGSIEREREAALDGIARATTRFIAQAAPNPLVVFWAPEGRLELWAQTDESIALTGKEMAVAEWAHGHGEEAGAGTETLASTEFFFVPMMFEERSLGVIGLKVSADTLLPEQRRLLRSIAGLAALAASRWLETEGRT